MAGLCYKTSPLILSFRSTIMVYWKTITNKMDGIEFFKKELERTRFPYYVRTKMRQQLAWRLIGFEGWMRGG